MTDKEQIIIEVTQKQFEEYQKLKQELNFARNEVHQKTEYIKEQRDIIDWLKQECEELKEEISKLQLNEYHYKNELKKYKKGIHKYRNLLKYEINNLRLSRREFLKMVGRYPKFEKDNIKLALDTFNRKLELIDNPSRYHKALDDIEKYLEDEE